MEKAEYYIREQQLSYKAVLAFSILLVCQPSIHPSTVPTCIVSRIPNLVPRVDVSETSDDKRTLFLDEVYCVLVN